MFYDKLKRKKGTKDGMAKQEFHIEDYLNDISPDYADFIMSLHSYLTENGCVLTLKQAANGHVASYSKNKKVIANFVSRKKGPVVRIYGDNVSKYIGFMETLPDGMIKAVAKAPACKRLLDPAACNSRCSMGYDFTVKGAHHQKCKYNCFMFEINAENYTYIKDFLENELRERAA